MAYRRWSCSVWYAFACAVGRERNGEATLCFCAATPPVTGRCYGDDVNFTIAQCSDVEACVAVLRERCPQVDEDDLADAANVIREFVRDEKAKS